MSHDYNIQSASKYKSLLELSEISAVLCGRQRRYCSKITSIYRLLEIRAHLARTSIPQMSMQLTGLAARKVRTYVAGRHVTRPTVMGQRRHLRSKPRSHFTSQFLLTLRVCTMYDTMAWLVMGKTESQHAGMIACNDPSYLGI